MDARCLSMSFFLLWNGHGLLVLYMTQNDMPMNNKLASRSKHILLVYRFIDCSCEITD